MCQLLFWLCSQRDNHGADTAVAADVRSRPQAGQRHAEGPPSLFAQWRGCGCGRRRAKKKYGMSYSSRRRTDTPRFAVPLRLTRLVFRRAHLDLITAEYRPAFSPGLSACGCLATDSSAAAFLSHPPRPSTSRRLAFRASRKEFSASQLAMQFPVSIPRDGRSVKICGR